MSPSWTLNDVPKAGHLWRQIRLVCGGERPRDWASCRAYRLGICEAAAGANAELPCGCRHWYNLAVCQRRMLIASRAGLPVGLIALMVDDGSPKFVAAQISVIQRIAEIEPLKSYVERITERVPMWRERPAREGIADAAGL